jgi:hypothetical protein
MDVIVICKCDGLWVVQDKVYCNWRAVAVKVYDSANMRIDADAFREDGNEGGQEGAEEEDFAPEAEVEDDDEAEVEGEVSEEEDPEAEESEEEE